MRDIDRLATDAAATLIRFFARALVAQLPRTSRPSAAPKTPCHAYALNAKLDALMRLTPTHAARAKLKQPIAGCRRRLFVFLDNRAIPATNNGSGQALRPCVVFRKVTNSFRSEWAAELYADTRSVIEVARRHAVDAFQRIRVPLAPQPVTGHGVSNCVTSITLALGSCLRSV